MPGAVATHSDAVHVIYLDTCDFDEDGDDWSDLVEFIRTEFPKHWFSLRDMDKWVDCDIRRLLGNDLASIGIAEYFGMAAISIWPEVANYTVSEDLAQHWCEQVCGKMQKLMDKTYPGLTLNRTSAYTSEVR